MEQQTIGYKLKLIGPGTLYGEDTIQSMSAVAASPVLPAGTYDSPYAFNFVAANLQSFFALATQPMTLKWGGSNETQTISFGGVIASGSFTLSYNGQTTAALAFNATAAQVQAALSALSTIGAGNVTVSGGPIPASFVVAFKNARGRASLPAMTATSSLVGVLPTITIARTTPGVAPDKIINLAAGIPQIWTVNMMYANPFSVNSTTVYATNAGATQGTLYLRAQVN